MLSISANLARSLESVGFRRGSCLNTILFRIPVWNSSMNCQRCYPLLGRVRAFSSQAYELTPNFSLLNEITRFVFSSPSKINKNKKNEEVDIDYLDKAINEKKKGNIQKEFEYYGLAIEKGSDIREIMLAKSFRGNQYRKIGELDKAIKDLSEAIQETPDFRPEESDFRDLSYAYQQKGDSFKAIEILQKGIKYSPNSESLYYELGEIYLKINDAKQALIYLEKTINMLDKDPWVSINTRLYEFFLPVMKETVLKLKNCTDAEIPAVYAKLQEARASFTDYHPFHMG